MVHAVPVAARRGHQIPLALGVSVVSHHEGAGTQTQTLWKSKVNPPVPPFFFFLCVVTEALVYDRRCVMC